MSSSSLRSILFVICFVYGSYAENYFTTGLLPLKIFKFGFKAYYFCDTFNATFFDAGELYKEFGMQLVSIPNQQINKLLHQTILWSTKGFTYWTSGIDLIAPRKWIWLSSAEPVTYTNWAPDQPDSVLKRCIEVRSEKTDNYDLIWYNGFCKKKHNFICETPYDYEYTSDSTPSFYIGGPRMVTYDTAIAKCEERGQMLVSIQNRAKQEAVEKFLQETGIQNILWTSGNRLADKKTWRWLSGEAVKYTFWNKGDPDNKFEDEECMIITRGDRDKAVLSDVPCNRVYFYICESKP